MRASEIEIGGHYTAKVSGKLTTVRVDAIRKVDLRGYGRGYTAYDVTNLTTGRHTTFRSARRFYYRMPLTPR